MKLSIIVPFYNVNRYIGKAIDSILQQINDNSDFEIIMVDDGSTDKSADIVERYKKNNQNIKIYSQQNLGVSVARNIGISHASGDYVTFLDADDTLIDKSLEKITKLITCDTNSDIIFCNIIKENEYRYGWQEKFSHGEKYTYEEVRKSGYFRGSSCGTLYNRNFLLKKDIHFIPGVTNGEDSIFVFECMSNATSFMFWNIDFYFVYNRAGSASNIYNNKRFIGTSKGIQYVYIKAKDESLPCKNRIAYNELLYNQISALVYTLAGSYHGYKVYQEYNIKRYLPIDLNGNRFAKKAKILNFSSILFFVLVSIKKRLG